MLQKWFSLVFVSLTVSYKMFSSVKRKKLSCSDQSNLVIKSKDAEIVKEVVWSLISLVLDFACGNVLEKQSEVCMFETFVFEGNFLTLCVDFDQENGRVQVVIWCTVHTPKIYASNIFKPVARLSLSLFHTKVKKFGTLINLSDKLSQPACAQWSWLDIKGKTKREHFLKWNITNDIAEVRR